MQGTTHDLAQPEVAQKLGTVFSPLILMVGLLCSVGALALFAWLAREVLFESDFARFDLAVRTHIHSYATPALTAWMNRVSFLGSVGFLTTVTIALCILFLIVRWRRAAGWLAVNMVGAGVLDAALKQVFHRARPVAFFGTAPKSYSFPSGHALASFCFYGVLAGLLATRLRKRALGAVLWVAAAVLIAAIGVSRIYLGVHYSTDVLAGYLAAAVWVGALLFADQIRTRSYAPSRERGKDNG